MEQKCNVIYIFSINLPHFEGLIKFGQIMGTFNVDPYTIADNDPLLVAFAKKGIDQLASTASTFCKLLYCTIGLTFKTHQNIDVKEIYDCLKAKGILSNEPSNNNDWYKLSLKKALRAIRAVKNENLNVEIKD